MSRPALALAAGALCLAPSAALAGPTFGVAISSNSGASTPADAYGYGAPGNTGALTTLGAFARFHLTGPLSVQGEAEKVRDDGTHSGTTMRSVNALLVLELTHGPLVPSLLLGGGVDDVQYADGSVAGQQFGRGEIGLSLEYRFAGGLVLGADVREGVRQGPSSPQIIDSGYGGGCGEGNACPLVIPQPTYAASSFAVGAYTAARLTLGYHF